jgi:NADPH-dependent 2,4-dienoyl-CoA reductase/sulfur reductase-like enzyme
MIQRGGKLVIIGGLAAGLSAAGRARRLDPGLAITVLEAGEAIAYGVCGLPFVVSRRIPSVDNLVFQSPEQYANERNVDVRVRTRAVNIRPVERRVVIEHDNSRSNFDYDRLVIATGAIPIVPFEVPPGARGIFTLRALQDAVDINAWIEEEQPRAATVIGAGVLGLEMADVLHARGLEISMVEKATRPAPWTDPETSSQVSNLLRASGVKFYPGIRIGGIELGRKKQVRSLVLDNTEVPCDMVIVAAGATPNTRIAKDAGIFLDDDGAIAVDGRMLTNVDGIYAAGDCIAVKNCITGKLQYQPTASIAVKCGRVAGTNAAGFHEEFPGALNTRAITLFGRELASAGLSLEEAKEFRFKPVVVSISAQGNPAYMGEEPDTLVRLIADADRKFLIGAQLFGPQGAILRLGILAAAITAQVKLEELAACDLPYAPTVSSVIDPIQVAARELLKKL